MNNVHLQPGAVYTCGGSYRGFGFFVAIYLLFAAFLAWHLGQLAANLRLPPARCLDIFLPSISQRGHHLEIRSPATDHFFRSSALLRRLGRLRRAVESFAKRLSTLGATLCLQTLHRLSSPFIVRVQVQTAN
jgi:hypothetical protein